MTQFPAEFLQTVRYADGRIVSASVSGPSPADSSFTYTVSVDTPTGPIVLPGVEPLYRQWPAAVVDTVPAEPGTPCRVLFFGTKVNVILTETPNIGDCPEVSP